MPPHQLIRPGYVPEALSPSRRFGLTRRHVCEASARILQALEVDGIAARDARARVLADGRLLVIATWPDQGIGAEEALHAATRVAALLHLNVARVQVGTHALLAGRASLSLFWDDEAVTLRDHADVLERLVAAS